MHNLYIMNEIITNSLDHNYLFILSILAVLSGILVIISKNPIVSILFLIGLFLTIASYLMMLGINFIGLSYLLVYVGAVSILFLFILMLINIRISELADNSNNSLPLAIFIGIFFNVSLSRIFINNISSHMGFPGESSMENYTIYNNIKDTLYSLFNNELFFVTSYT